MNVLSKIFGRLSSKDVAKQRLEILLFHDRNNFPPALIEAMRRDIVHVLSRYVEIDMEALEFDLTRVKTTGRSSASALVANIPIVNVKDKNYR